MIIFKTDYFGVLLAYLDKLGEEKMVSSEMRPLVSVVIPVYNAEEYIKECLDSIMGQSLDAIEVICVDDASTDSSREIIEEYCGRDCRLQYIFQEKANAGVARNRGMRVARGSYIAFIDADDYCDRHMLEKLYDKAKSLNADIVVCESRMYSMKSEEFSIPSYMVRDELIPETDDGCFSYRDCPDDIFQLFGMAPWNKLFNLETLKSNNLQAQSLPAANDVLLTASALVCADRIAVHHEVLYTQRKDMPSSITGRLDLFDKWRCGALSALALKSFLEERGCYTEVKKSYHKLAAHSVSWYLEKVRSSDLKIYAKYYHTLKERWLADLDLLTIEADETLNASDYKAIQQIIYSSFEETLLGEVARLDKAVWKKTVELNKIKHGRDYRLGKAIMKYPRKAVKLMRRIKKRNALVQANRAELRLRKSAAKRICVAAYEPFHYVVTANVVKVALRKADYVEAFVYSKAAADLSAMLGDDFNKVHWHLYPNKDSYFNRTKSGDNDWRARASEDIAKRSGLDCVVLVSPEYHPEYYAPILDAKERSFRVIAGAHNLNHAFSASGKNAEVVRAMGKADEYIVLDRALNDTIVNEGFTSKKVHVVPIVYDPDRVVSCRAKDGGNRHTVQFVITGLVEKERKDYEFVLSALSDAPEILSSIKLTLLGNASSGYGQHIINMAEPLKDAGLTIVSYQSFVSDEEFESVMNEADCIIGPVRPHTATQLFDEVYGVTKLSGIVGDMVQYALPAIVPQKLNMPSDLDGSYIAYSDKHNFIKALRSLLDPSTLAEYKNTALRNSEKYALDPVCQSSDLFD